MDARAKTVPSDDFQKSASDFRSPVTVPADETEIADRGASFFTNCGRDRQTYPQQNQA